MVYEGEIWFVNVS